MVKQRRKNIVIRQSILKALSKGQSTINEISLLSGVNWRSVERHLTYLKGKDLVKEIFSSRFVRIYELSELGREYVEEELKHKIEDKKIRRMIRL